MREWDGSTRLFLQAELHPRVSGKLVVCLAWRPNVTVIKDSGPMLPNPNVYDSFKTDRFISGLMTRLDESITFQRTRLLMSKFLG